MSTTGKGSHVRYFPDGRKTLFSVGGIQDFRDGIGHQVAVFFQQPAGCSVRSAGLPWIEDIQCSLYVHWDLLLGDLFLSSGVEVFEGDNP